MRMRFNDLMPFRCGDAEFNESRHPRDKDGKFAKIGGGQLARALGNAVKERESEETEKLFREAQKKQKEPSENWAEEALAQFKCAQVEFAKLSSQLKARKISAEDAIKQAAKMMPKACRIEDVDRFGTNFIEIAGMFDGEKLAMLFDKRKGRKQNRVPEEEARLTAIRQMFGYSKLFEVLQSGKLLNFCFAGHHSSWGCRTAHKEYKLQNGRTVRVSVDVMVKINSSKPIQIYNISMTGNRGFETKEKENQLKMTTGSVTDASSIALPGKVVKCFVSMVRVRYV